MSKRLQVVVDDGELRRFRAAAKRAGLTLSEWVRQSLRATARDTPSGDVRRVLAAVDRAVEFGESADVPAPAIERLLEEIERGYEQRDVPA